MIMRIRWSQRALKEWKRIAEYIEYEFGLQVAEGFESQTVQKEELLLKNPELGHPEQLLIDKKIQYRSLIFTRHNKMIYYIKADEIRISDIWDMRRNPEILAKRITTK